VVYDSIPEHEFLEHQNKARALLTAIGQVRRARP
jgi:anthranilate/para-aminobenzoate synthase component I